MTALLTAAQMRAIEAAAIATGAVTGLDLMERAGRGVLDAVFAQWPDLAAVPGRAVVLCGPGNNGGDGFVVARLLQEWGWKVSVFLFGDAARMPPDARVNYERWLASETVGDLAQARIDRSDLVIDAVFGTGLARSFALPAPLGADFRRVMREGFWSTGKAARPYVVAIDVVSQIDADSGRALGSEAERGAEMGAHLTVTFHRPRIGHYLDEGSGRSGALRVVDIGLGEIATHPAVVGRVDGPLVATGPSLTKRSHDPMARGHKYAHGHALILSGGPGKGGAARLAARGALRIGAGLVTMAVPPAALQENAARLDAVMLRSLKDADALSAWLHEDARINALCIGPGFGTSLRHGAWVEAVLDARRPVVLDADALTLVARDSVLFGKLHPSCVLTPHGGEFARLFPDIAAKLAEPATRGPAYSKVDATREAARRAGCVVLFKGPDTVIADPEGRCSINASHYERAAPWLATAGSGDVLAGFIAGLLARGFAPMQAAEMAAWLHVECARSFGPGLIAEDLPEELPAVFRALGL